MQALQRLLRVRSAANRQRTGDGSRDSAGRTRAATSDAPGAFAATTARASPTTATRADWPDGAGTRARNRAAARDTGPHDGLGAKACDCRHRTGDDARRTSRGITGIVCTRAGGAPCTGTGATGGIGGAGSEYSKTRNPEGSGRGRRGTGRGGNRTETAGRRPGALAAEGRAGLERQCRGSTFEPTLIDEEFAKDAQIV